jgi:hypothetical protein
LDSPFIRKNQPHPCYLATSSPCHLVSLFTHESLIPGFIKIILQLFFSGIGRIIPYLCRKYSHEQAGKTEDEIAQATQGFFL